jgi:PHD/YefM family antitoxin component YafN of YafNO toxin-antitoxin module
MRFISVRDLRNRPGDVWKSLEEEDLVLTSNGRPRGILLALEGEDLERTLETLRRARAQTSLSRLRRQATDKGTDRLAREEIEREIRSSRTERRQA